MPEKEEAIADAQTSLAAAEEKVNVLQLCPGVVKHLS